MITYHLNRSQIERKKFTRKGCAIRKKKEENLNVSKKDFFRQKFCPYDVRQFAVLTVRLKKSLC